MTSVDGGPDVHWAGDELTAFCDEGPDARWTDEVARSLNDYCWYVDTKDPVGLSSVFHQDFQFTVEHASALTTICGRSTYLDWLAPRLERLIATRHRVSPLYIDARCNGSDVSAAHRMEAWHRFSNRTDVGRMWGEYHDRLVPQAGRYVVINRRFRILRSINM